MAPQGCWYSGVGTRSIVSAHTPSNGHQIASTPLPQTVLQRITNLSPWALSSVETGKRSDEKFRQGFAGTCAATQGNKKKQVPLLTLQGAWTGFFRGVSVGADGCIGLDWRLRWSAHRLGGALCRNHVQHPAFAPGTSEVAVGSFCILLS